MEADDMSTSKPASVSIPPFPTMLQMWTGSEVQTWIDENIKPLLEDRYHYKIGAKLGEPLHKRAVECGMMRFHLITLVAGWKTGQSLNERFAAAEQWMKNNGMGGILELATHASPTKAPRDTKQT